MGLYLLDKDSCDLSSRLQHKNCHSLYSSILQPKYVYGQPFDQFNNCDDYLKHFSSFQKSWFAFSCNSKLPVSFGELFSIFKLVPDN